MTVRFAVIVTVLGVSMLYFANKLTRLSNLSVWRIPSEAAQELAALAQRSMQLQATLQEGTLMLGDGARTVDIELVRWK